MKTILWVNKEGETIVTIPTKDDDFTLDKIVAKKIPEGCPYWFVDNTELPPNPGTLLPSVNELGAVGATITNLKSKIRVDRSKLAGIQKKLLKLWAYEYMNSMAVDNEYDDMEDLLEGLHSSDQVELSEAQKGVAFKNQIRSYIKQLVKDIKSGSVEMPSKEQFKSNLPILTLP